MVRNTLVISTLFMSGALVACDGPVEPLQVPVSASQNPDGVAKGSTAPQDDSSTEAGMAPEGQDSAPLLPTEEDEAASEATGNAVEGSDESPAVGPYTADQEDEEEQEDAQATEPPPTPSEPKYQGSPATPWSGQGTASMPKFGVNCRLSTPTVYESATNGEIDDTIHFTTFSSNTATLDIFVQGYGGEALNLNVDINRGLSGRSFRQATGTASYDGLVDVPVVDGTLCFEQKATPGEDVLAEFSFVINDGGTYTSFAGLAMIPGDAISMPSAGLTIDAADELDIDLR